MAFVETALIMIASFALGAAHAFEVDHMTAVSSFIAQRPTPRRAALFGIKWAAGHGISLLLFGTALFALKLSVPDGIAQWFERAVGLALLLVGFFSIARLWRSTHRTAMNEAKDKNHEHSSFLMGLLHGLAGTAAFFGQSLIVAARSYSYVAGYTLAFSCGVLCAMALYAIAFGSALNWTGQRSRNWLHRAQLATAVWSCGVGFFWLLQFKLKI